MYGWRGRCGLIIPVDNTVMEPELGKFGIEGVSFHAARLMTSQRSEMPAQGMEMATIFPEMGVDAVVYACAETSFLEGTDANSVIIRTIEEATGLPATTATWAMVLALQHLAASRIGLVTPYTQERGEVMEGFFARCGFEVVRSDHRDFQAGTEDPRDWYHTNLQPPSTAYRMARRLDSKGIDVLLISATNFRTFEIIEQLEADLGIPVVACNQAILWWFGQQMGIAGVPPMGALGRRR